MDEQRQRGVNIRSADKWLTKALQDGFQPSPEFTSREVATRSSDLPTQVDPTHFVSGRVARNAGLVHCTIKLDGRRGHRTALMGGLR